MTKMYARLVGYGLAVLIAIGIMAVSTEVHASTQQARTATLVVDGKGIQVRTSGQETAYTLAGTRVQGFITTPENFIRRFGDYEFSFNGNVITAEQAFYTLSDIIFDRANGIVIMNTPTARLPVTAITPPQETLEFPTVYEDIQTAFEQEVIRIVNEIRAGYGLQPLVFHVELAEVARLRSTEMVYYNVRGHLSPTTGLEHTEHARAMGLNLAFAGENSVRGPRTPQGAVDAWIASTVHREALLSGHSTSSFPGLGYVGVGFAYDERITAWTLWLTCNNPA